MRDLNTFIVNENREKALEKYLKSIEYKIN